MNIPSNSIPGGRPPPIAHPLEVIPVFRRWPSSVPRNVLYTIIFSCAVALVLTAVDSARGASAQVLRADFPATLLISNLIGALVYGGMLVLNRSLDGWVARLRGFRRMLFYVALMSVGVPLGIGLGNVLLRGTNPLVVLAQRGVWVYSLATAVFVGGFMYLVHRAGEQRMQAAMATARNNELIASSQRLLAEARLRALQAQIEPHFLYNTLANVVGLIGTQPARAQHMLERFIDYLRASLAASRGDQTTLASEAALLAAYLDVLAVRMGERLRYRIDLPDDLRGFAIAPMLLQPVVENAITHGLEPKVEGGEIAIAARVLGDRVCVEISDTGVGLAGQGAASRKPGGGVGLSNLRERLASLYGGAARVELLENQPCGMTVRLMLPLNASPTSIPSTP
ncbi:Histidine kinase-, DNA gyrase B-, and HSP90-like ATPase [Duganella sp. CF517]|uniref:sensor histidine kinase n=1 Tax=Duganella sp. CF517 TaxID=1881038 RepID=UPI0008BEF314|nr:histidine kinase [Duganella sp. CF517]SEN79576.1 Histidine kinase-, DNA gyrase B-, and HSP90-like ATPase [Duganella sp. CF517]